MKISLKKIDIDLRLTFKNYLMLLSCDSDMLNNFKNYIKYYI